MLLCMLENMILKVLAIMLLVVRDGVVQYPNV